jgi:hypothetical protein
MARLFGLGTSQHQAGLHAWPGFISPHYPGSHFHSAIDLLGVIICLGDGWIAIESTKARPSFTQPDEQVPQLFDRCELVDTFPPADFHLFPQSIQAFGAIWG